MTTTLLDTPPAVLAPALDAAARRYIAARTRSGDALLEAVAALADARAAAQHGQWGIFLAAVGLDDSRARALIRLHDACLTDRALADRVRSGWLSEAAARELLPAPPDVRAAVLDAAEPPTLQDVREAKRAATPDLHRVQTTPEARDADGPWFKARKSANHPTAHHWNIRPTERGMYVAACGIECADLLAADANIGLCSVCARHADRRALVPWTMPNRAATPALLPTPVPQPPPLPALPDPLCYTWTRWRNEDGAIGMQHVSGYKISGTDAGDVEDLARQLSRPLAELHDHAWRVSYDPGADGRTDLHAYTATHEEFDAISASTIQRLALAAWWARQAEDDVPNMPDDVIDGLWLAGYDWTGTAWVRGFERVDEDANLNELRYQLGLTQDAPIPAVATPVPHLPADWADTTARASRIGLHLTMNALGQFKLTDANGAIVDQFDRTDWAGMLAELARRETQTLFCTTCGKRITNGHFDGQCGPCYRAPSRIDAGALGALGTRLTETSDPRELATLYRAIGLLLAAGGVLPALPVRPRLPRSADVSKQMQYLDALEKYANVLEDRLGVRE